MLTNHGIVDLNVLVLAATALACLLASAFFSGTETGLLSISRERILHLSRKGGRRARTIQRALADMGRATSTILIGNNIANVSYSSASAAVIVELIADSSFRSLANVAAAVLILYFGEFLPKLVFSARPLRLTLLIAPVFQVVASVLSPLTWLAMKLTDLLLPGPAAKRQITRGELSQIIHDRLDGVCLSDIEHLLITHLIALRAKGQPITKESVYAIASRLPEKAQDARQKRNSTCQRKK